MANLKKIFIDGSAGTTGLRIRDRLASRGDIQLITLPDELRKDPEARGRALNEADLVFLCLPDAAAVEATGLIHNPETVIIDTSTAHRTSESWEYGFPELEGRRERIAHAKCIANPGCHASGFIALVEPLIRRRLLTVNERLCCFSLTGYSGGGRKMIEEYETAGTQLHIGGRQYALGQKHKHLPEMARVCGLVNEPCFSPVVVPNRCGMEVTVQLFDKDIEQVKDIYREYYQGNGLVRFVEDPSEDGFLSSAALSGRDDMEVSAFGNGERVILVSRFDNLGKGASGAAIQNMNLVLGCDETTGLRFEVKGQKSN